MAGMERPFGSGFELFDSALHSPAPPAARFRTTARLSTAEVIK
jgi:hypothetical protein